MRHRKITFRQHDTSGFTLIELLVVVAVMSAASLMAFGVFSEDRIQIRYDDTRTRLNLLRSSILGSFSPLTVTNAGGFVADNGDLPNDLATLMQSGTLLAQGVQTPVFDAQPDVTTCANNGGEYIDPFGVPADVNAQLIKGHRGDYLGGMAFNNRFRDGWGNVASTNDANDSGWSLSKSTNTLNITSLGADNAVGGVDFAADIGLTIKPADWLIPLQGWTVTITNMSGTDINNSQKLSVSLLVFRNTATGEWRRYSTPIASNVCLDGNGNGTVDHDGDAGAITAEIACPTKMSFSFAANCKAGDTSSGPSSIPQGRHLLIITSHTGATLWNGSDSPNWKPGKQAIMRIDAIAGMPLPEAQVVLR